MAYKKVVSLECNITVTLDGKFDSKTGKKNPTSIEGYYLGAKQVPDKFNPEKGGKLHVFQTEKGNIGVFGKTDSNSKLAAIKPGTMVLMEANGSVRTNKGKDKLLFEVSYDDTNTIEVTSASADISNEAESDYENLDADSDDDNSEAETYAYQASAPAAVQTGRVSANMSLEERKARTEALLKKK